jgi:hypothetical protein
MVITAPRGVPAGTFTFRSVRSGRPFSRTRPASRSANSAAAVKSPSAPRTARETASEGRPKNVPSRAPPTVPE